MIQCSMTLYQFIYAVWNVYVDSRSLSRNPLRHPRLLLWKTGEGFDKIFSFFEVKLFPLSQVTVQCLGLRESLALFGVDVHKINMVPMSCLSFTLIMNNVVVSLAPDRVFLTKLSSESTLHVCRISWKSVTYPFTYFYSSNPIWSNMTSNVGKGVSNGLWFSMYYWCRDRELKCFTT